MRVLSVFLTLLFLFPVYEAQAVNPDEILPDAEQEARARDISAGLRCLVCQNQSIDDSDADLAKDLRRVVRERIEAGDSDDEVMTYVVDRYGEYVLLSPPVNAATLLLWFGPAVLLGCAAVGGMAYYRGQRKKALVPQGLTADEEARINALLDDERDRDGEGRS